MCLKPNQHVLIKMSIKQKQQKKALLLPDLFLAIFGGAARCRILL